MENKTIHNSLHSIRFTKLKCAYDRITSRSKISLNSPSVHNSSKTLQSTAALKSYCGSHKSVMSSEVFLERYSELHPFCKHSRIQQLNTFSKDFLKIENIFRNSGFRQLASQLQSETQKNSLNQEILCELIDYALSAETRSRIIRCYEYLKDSCQGFSLTSMVICFGVHLNMVFSDYQKAFRLLEDMLSLILYESKDEYLTVYLRIKIIALCNHGDTNKALGYLKKLVKISWMYRLIDAQLWCYHQMSKLYLMNHEVQLSGIMSSKFQEGIYEGNTKYRAIMIDILSQEIREMKKTRNDFNLTKEDIDVFLLRRKYKIDSTQISLSLKEVRLIATKLNKQQGDRFQRILPKLFQQRRKTKDEEQVQINLMMTHLSKIKNFSGYFRGDIVQRTPTDGLITIENPSLNWPVLRQMLRRIAQEYLSGRPFQHVIGDSPL